MRLSIERLRWMLLVGAVLLVAVLGAFIGYGRYRALKTYTQLLRRSGVTITHETDGFTYSQSVQGKTIFTIHAAKAVQHGEGQYTLHDAVMTFYGREPGITDHVYGSEVEYDETEGVARAHGEVHMDLKAPQALAGAHPDSPQREEDGLIHVRTSGLVYLRKLGVAATDQPVEFRYGDVRCTSRGAEFNTSQSTLKLLADVVLNGESHGQPVQITATHADMDRTANIADLTLPVVTSLGRSARSQTARLTLRSDGSIQRVQASDGVVLQSVTPNAGTRQITAAHLDATLNQQTEPQTARLDGDVLLTDSNPLQPMHGSAAQVEARFNQQGIPVSVTASGGARLESSDRHDLPQGLARELQAEKVVALFAPAAKRGPNAAGAKSSAQLRQLIATGDAQARGESLAVAKGTPRKAVAPGALKSTLVAGDELQLSFAAGATGQPQPQTLNGTGHTLLQQDAPLQEEQTSKGDMLQIAFAPAVKAAGNSTTGHSEYEVANAVQSGHVTVVDRAASRPGAVAQAVSTASAERARYDGAMQRLTLTGAAHLNGDNSSVTAQTVVMDRQTDTADAIGDVHATYENVPANGAASRPQPATHVLSASAHFDHQTKVATFHGTDAQPARLWQEASQVQAANLLLDGDHHTFSAWPAGPSAKIHAVFAGTPSANPSPKAGAKPGSSAAKPAATNLVRVTGPKMDYDDMQREAVFTGGVQMDGTLGEVRSQRAMVYLTPAQVAGEKKPAATAPQPPLFGGSVERVVVSGEVQIEQPERHGTGEQLVYTAATDKFVLTGTPEHRPVIVDAQQGSVTGTTLTFGASGSTIEVTGAPGSTVAKGTRVRTETEVRQ